MIILDTHALLWFESKDRALGPHAFELAEEALNEDELGVSAITFCEVAALVAGNRLRLRLPVTDWRRDLLDYGVVEHSVDGEIAIGAVALAGFHKDPADRLIVATALATDSVLVTADERILAWPGPLDRVDARL